MKHVIAYSSKHQTKFTYKSPQIPKVSNPLHEQNPFKPTSTSFISINNPTLHDYFVYERNIIVLSQPKLLDKKICFTPSHIGEDIIVSYQNDDFKKDFSNLTMFDYVHCSNSHSNCLKDQLFVTKLNSYIF